MLKVSSSSPLSFILFFFLYNKALNLNKANFSITEESYSLSFQAYIYIKITRFRFVLQLGNSKSYTKAKNVDTTKTTHITVSHALRVISVKRKIEIHVTGVVAVTIKDQAHLHADEVTKALFFQPR